MSKEVAGNRVNEVRYHANPYGSKKALCFYSEGDGESSEGLSIAVARPDSHFSRPLSGK